MNLTIATASTAQRRPEEAGEAGSSDRSATRSSKALEEGTKEGREQKTKSYGAVCLQGEITVKLPTTSFIGYRLVLH